MESGIKKVDINTEHVASDVSVSESEIQIFNLYMAGHKNSAQPFVHQLSIDTGIGGTVRVWASFDDGALTNAMSLTKFQTVKHCIGCCKASSR